MASERSEAHQRALHAGIETWGSCWNVILASRAPGRLELLGNHIDYNGGPVLAAAINRDVVCLLGASELPGISVVFPDIGSELHHLDIETLHEWRNPAGALVPLDYVRGVMATTLARGGKVRDTVTLSIAGDVPIGFGLSSSAALCIALTQALCTSPPTGRDLVLWAQEAEHRAGTPCGTMDQSASVGGEVILFDGSTVTWKSISPDLDGHVFAVANSGISRSLATSSYAKRVDESRIGLDAANQLLGTGHANLAELSNEELEVVLANDGVDQVIKKRIRHIVTETFRVREGIDAVAKGNWDEFGKLMTLSGKSSAFDYEISHPSVEELVSIVSGVSGVLGARMMGGGEGGTALILLHERAEAELRGSLHSAYFRSREMNSSSALQVLQFAAGASLENGQHA